PGGQSSPAGGPGNGCAKAMGFVALLLAPSSALQATDREKQAEQGNAAVQRQVPRIYQASAKVLAEMQRHRDETEEPVNVCSSIHVRPPDPRKYEYQANDERQ